MTEAKPSDKLSGLLDFLLSSAKDMIEEFGQYDPVGMVLTQDGQVVMLDSTFWQAEGLAKGMTSNQLLRRIEDGIREIRGRQTIDCAIMFYDATLRSQDGSGDPVNALVGRLEERRKGAFQVIVEYEVEQGHFRVKSKYFIRKEPHLIPD